MKAGDVKLWVNDDENIEVRLVRRPRPSETGSNVETMWWVSIYGDTSEDFLVHEDELQEVL